MEENAQRSDRVVKRATGGVLVGGLLFLVSGGLHPQPADGIKEIDLAVADMASQDGWYASHILSGSAFVVIGISLAMMIRHAWPRGSRLATVGWVVVAGAAMGAIDTVPHILAATEVDELVAGGSTPLSSTHMATQALATPLFGGGLALLAVVGARTRLLGHWAVAILGVVGGTVWAAAGPGVALDIDGAPVLFAGGFFVSLFLILSGILGIVRSRRATAAEGDRVAATAAAT